MAHNILVVIDSGSASWRAVEQAVAVTRSYRSRVKVICAPRAGWLEAIAQSATGDPYPAIKSRMDAAEETLSTAIEAFPADVPVATQLHHAGSLLATIQRSVDENGHDLVILGTKLGPLARRQVRATVQYTRPAPAIRSIFSPDGRRLAGSGPSGVRR
jgi:nucleotide-binding universal stress UspA family protein